MGKGKNNSENVWPEGLGGISKKGMFKILPAWVDEKLDPGTSDQTEALSLKQTARDISTLAHFLYSPNLVWFAMAITIYVFFPYPIEQAKDGFAAGWMLTRFALNYSVAFAYYAFFYFGLYYGDWAARKFRPGVYPTAGNMAHNMWYWSLAIVQWTWWECVMVRLWANGTVGYTPNSVLLSSPKDLAINVAWVLAIPVWRNFHFYIAHRFIHVRAIYKYVHSLHHRNADPEPFSGMTMHPIEHLYYFSNAFTPSLYLNLSPLVFLWNFIHLTIAPGAGHSGFEDHFQADQYHYVHHAKFECNYGSPQTGFIDQYFGTFREKLGTTKAYKGEFKDDDKNAKVKKTKAWSPNGYLGMPASWDHGAYTLFWAALFPLMWWGAIGNRTADGGRIVSEVMGVPIATVLGGVIAYSPVIVAMVLAKVAGDRLSWRWPFQKERVVGAFGLFFILGFLACLLPIYHAVKWIC